MMGGGKLTHYSGRLTALIAFAAMTAAAIAPAGADQTDLRPGKAAETILSGVPGGKKIAIRPFFTSETDLPEPIADDIYNELFDAFFAASQGAHAFVDRTNLLKIRKSREAFFEEDLEQLLAAARADIEVICTPTPHPRGVTLACSAVDLYATTTLGRAQFVMPVDAISTGTQPYELALGQLAESLSPLVPDLARIDAIAIRDHNQGTQTDLGAWLGKQLATRLESRVSRDRQKAMAAYEREKALSDTLPPPPSATTVYRLTGTYYRLDEDSAQLLVALHSNGETKAKGSAKLTTASLPDGIAPDSGPRETVYRAVGEAILSDRLDRDAALRAARNLARARVVAQALGQTGPAVKTIRSEADAAHVLTQSLSRGIPVEERFITLVTDAKDKVTVELRARVIPVGTLIRPDIRASLNKATFRALEPIYVDLRGSATTYIGLYAWGADNRVVRLYPAPDTTPLTVEPDAPLLLPQPGQGEIVSMPLPGPHNQEDHEALIVVASTKPIDFAALAPMAGASLSQTMTTAVDGSRFFNALGETDLSRMALHILPYQVRR